jgi:hypothetical protein
MQGTATGLSQNVYVNSPFNFPKGRFSVKKLLAILFLFGLVCALSGGIVGCSKDPKKTTTPAATTPAKTTT